MPRTLESRSRTVAAPSAPSPNQSCQSFPAPTTSPRLSLHAREARFACAHRDSTLSLLCCREGLRKWVLGTPKVYRWTQAVASGYPLHRRFVEVSDMRTYCFPVDTGARRVRAVFSAFLAHWTESELNRRLESGFDSWSLFFFSLRFSIPLLSCFFLLVCSWTLFPNISLPPPLTVMF